jgi:hypothetical protein
VTTTSASQYDQLIDLMRRERLDFIGIDYAVDNRNVESTSSRSRRSAAPP